MAWIQSHQEIWEHPKTDALMELLGIERVVAVGILHRLWWWAMDYAKDGNLQRYSALQIAHAMQWAGPSDELISALQTAGWLDPNRTIHDWKEYGGKLLAKREAEAKRQADRRAQMAVSAPRTRDVQRTSHGTYAGRSDQIRGDKRRGDNGSTSDTPIAREAASARKSDWQDGVSPMDRFCAAYPLDTEGHFRGNRNLVGALWNKCVQPGEIEQVLQAVANYKAKDEVRRGKIKAAERFLEVWRNFAAPPAFEHEPVQPPANSDHEANLWTLRSLRQTLETKPDAETQSWYDQELARLSPAAREQFEREMVSKAS